MSALKCYYSGIEGESHFSACMNAGIQKVLISYLYIEKNKDFNVLKRRKATHPTVKFMVDSGAHSIQGDKEGYASWSLSDFENYIQRYCKWMLQNKTEIGACVELDIDWNVGPAVVEEWQKKYFVPLLEKGLPMIFVWHRQRGMEGWEEMCSRFPYVGLPGEFSKQPDFNKYINVARRYSTKVHGFAATAQSDFRDWAYAWHSSDSTSWKSSERYGTLIHWDEHQNKLLYVEDKAQHVNFKDVIARRGFNAEAIVKGTDYREKTRYALRSFRLMEAFYERMYKARVFFHDLRLPHHNVCSTMSTRRTAFWWKRLRVPFLFKQHAEEQNLSMQRDYLTQIAAVQYKDQAWLESHKGPVSAFLGVYFKKHLEPAITSMAAFQKELSAFIAPPNPPALDRTEPEHWTAQNNPPLDRAEKDWTLEELVRTDQELVSMNFEL